MEGILPRTPPYRIVESGGLYYIADGNGTNLCKEVKGCSFMWSEPGALETFASRHQLLDAGIIVLPYGGQVPELTEEDGRVLEKVQAAGLAGLTVEEAERTMYMVPLSPCFRRLALHGKIRVTGLIRGNLSGRAAVVWGAA